MINNPVNYPNTVAEALEGFTARSPGDTTTQKPNDAQPNDELPTCRRRSKKSKPVPVRTPYSPILAEDMARELVLCRLVENEERTEPRSLRQFAREMHEIGVTARQFSVSTLHRLFTGQMYPRLTDRDGVQINWALLPRASRGRRAGVSSQTSRLTRIEQQVKRLTSVMSYVCHRMGLPHDLAKDPSFSE
jgi:hypothetical protein